MSEEDKPRFRAIEGDRAGHDDAAAKEPLPGGDNDEAVKLKIASLEEEHRDLDQAILTMEERMPYDRLTIQRLKKRKLLIKDKIAELRDMLFPDIIA